MPTTKYKTKRGVTITIDSRTHTKNGKLRVGNRRKLTSERRYQIRELVWEPTKILLQQYCKAKYGNAQILAKQLGVHQSQIHRYECPECEHDQEPPYSVGMVMIVLLNEWKNSQLQIKPEILATLQQK